MAHKAKLQARERPHSCLRKQAKKDFQIKIRGLFYPGEPFPTKKISLFSWSLFIAFELDNTTLKGDLSVQS